MKKTKIICTLGPATDRPEILQGLIDNGMDLARFNFSHGTHADHQMRIDMLRKLAASSNKHIALLADTKGPEMRLGMFADSKVLLQEGQTFILTTEQGVVGNSERASVNYEGLAKEVYIGAQILLSDGLVSLEVTQIKGNDIYTKVLNNGEMSARKRVAVPGAILNLPFMSAADLEDIKFAIAQKMDYIAASFVQRAQDVLDIRKVLEAHGSNIGIIAKIENAMGVQNIEEIISVSEGIMVARGDLGVEIPAEDVPLVQKDIIKKCNKSGVPVITATQMLESMVKNPRPTRAESSDIANAILDGTDVIMLSGETASGDYPVEAVKTMSAIAKRAEAALEHEEIIRAVASRVDKTTTNAISQSTAQTASTLGATAILAATESGYTPRKISKYRPEARVIAMTPYESVARRMQLYWGVTPIIGNGGKDTDTMIATLIHEATMRGYVKDGDITVITAGVPIGKSGSTNLIYVHLVTNDALRGVGIGKNVVQGHVCVVETAKDFTEKFQDGDVLVVKALEEEYAKHALRASAVITEEGGLTSHAAIIAVSFGKTTVVGVEDATTRLRDGMAVTINPEQGRIYQGHVNAK